MQDLVQHEPPGACTVLVRFERINGHVGKSHQQRQEPPLRVADGQQRQQPMYSTVEPQTRRAQMQRPALLHPAAGLQQKISQHMGNEQAQQHVHAGDHWARCCAMRYA